MNEFPSLGLLLFVTAVLIFVTAVKIALDARKERNATSEDKFKSAIMAGMLIEASNTFERYANMHLAKGTQESLEKHKANHEMSRTGVAQAMAQQWGNVDQEAAA